MRVAEHRRPRLEFSAIQKVQIEIIHTADILQEPTAKSPADRPPIPRHLPEPGPPRGQFSSIDNMFLFYQDGNGRLLGRDGRRQK